MWRAVLLACVVMFVWVGESRGQVVFEPVQYCYSYGSGAGSFYYGGSRRAVFAREERIHLQRRVTPNESLPRVYSDAFPFWNASIYGYTINDARNDANAAVPTYFRKADLFPAGAVPPAEPRRAVGRPVLVIPKGAVQIRPARSWAVVRWDSAGK